MDTIQFTCTQENLLRGLARVAPVAGRNTQLPILNHSLLKLGPGGLTLIATDLDMGVQTLVGGRVEGVGNVALPAKNLLAYVQQLPNAYPITIKRKKSSVVVETKGYSAQFHIADPDDFPLLPQQSGKGGVQVKGEVLSTLLQQVLFASARDETRPEIRSVYITFSDTEVRAAATDSFRLAEVVVKGEFKQPSSFIIPLTAAQEIVRLFNNIQDEVTILSKDNLITIQSEEVHFSSRLIDGSYPDYRQIIPKTSTTTVEVARDEFIQALKTLAVFLPRDSRRVEVVVEPQNNKMVVQVASDGPGQGVAEVVVSGEGEAVKFLANIHYLLEGVQHMSGDVCYIGVSDDVSPVVIRPHKKGGYTYVVMPIKQ